MDDKKQQSPKCDLKELIRSIVTTLRISTASSAGFFFCNFGGVHTFVKLVPYILSALHKYKPMPNNQIDNEIKIATALRDNVLKKMLSPHIIELYDSISCDGFPANIEPKCIDWEDGVVDFENPVDRIMCRFRDYMKSGIYLNRYSILFYEPCTVTLAEYLQTSLPINEYARVMFIKTITFQVLYTIDAILSVYPKFHHGDMHLGNVLMRRMDMPADPFNPRYIRYRTPKREFNVVYYGVIPKIIDFGFSKLPEIGVIDDDRNPAESPTEPYDPSGPEYGEHFPIAPWVNIDDKHHFIASISAFMAGDEYLTPFRDKLDKQRIGDKRSAYGILRMASQRNFPVNLDYLFGEFCIEVDKSRIIAEYSIV